MLYAKNILIGITLLVLCLEKLPAQQQKGGDYPKEFVYVHLDKDFYVLGEFIWFKIYIQNTGEDFSPVVYLDITNSEGKVLKHLMLKINHRSAFGSFLIPDDWDTGIYHMRAYTASLLPYGAEAFYKQSISIYHPDPDRLPHQENSLKSNITVDFFPEGGSLIAGVPNRLVFQAQNSDGEGAAVKGYLKDDSDSTLLNFQSLFYEDSMYKEAPRGLGVFEWIPKAGKSYRAVIHTTNGASQSFVLPAVQIPGFAVRVENNPQQLHIELFGNESSYKAANCHILYQGKLMESILFNLSLHDSGYFYEKQTHSARKFPQGLLEIRFYGKENQLLAQRIIFNDWGQHPFLDMNLRQNTIQIREKISAQVQIKSPNGSLPTGNFQLFVKNKLQKNLNLHQADLCTYFLFSHALDGLMENPNFYRQNIGDEQIDQALNRALVTQKMKNFIKSSPPRLPLENQNDQFILRTTLKDVQSGLAVQSDIISRFTLEDQSSSEKPSRQPEGMFEETIKEFYGKRTFYYFNLNRGSHENNPIQVKIQDHPFGRYQVQSAALKYSDRVRDYLQDYALKKLVKTNYDLVSAQKTDSLTFIPLLKNFKPSQTVIMNEYIPFPNVMEIIREALHFLTARSRDGIIKLRIAPEDLNAGLYSQKPLFLVDGQPTFDQDLILNLSPDHLERIEVYAAFQTLRKLGGVLFTSGVADFTTKKRNINLSQNPNVIQVEGYHLSETFDAPQYSLEESRKNHIPDLRYLITWQPEINSLEKALEFYHSDEIGDFELIFQGITSEGIPIQKTIFYQVTPFKIP
ncbi:MAG: hypothetical protein NW226_03260 [Microscillaceae bacterium]|nr:hypothetical protein [Microscillaceae bacterium]